MTYRIEIISKVADTRAEIKKKWLESLCSSLIGKTYLVDVYTIDKKLTLVQIKKIASVLTNSVSKEFNIFSLKTSGIKIDKFDWAIETGFLPGVTDNVAQTTEEIIEDLLSVRFEVGEGVYTSQILFFEGKISYKKVLEIGENLVNPLIQRVHIKDQKKYLSDKGMNIVVPKVILKKKQGVIEVDLNVSDEKLEIIGKSGIVNRDGSRRGPLALDLAYMKGIKKYFEKIGRKPTDIEIESIAQTWSEHCKHTIFANPIDKITDGLYKTYIQAATNEIRKKKKDKDFCVSVFTDNSGAIEFNSKYLVTHKAETHNSPSALDPFGGAVTGICGVNRDAIGFGLGAKPIINTYGYCFCDPKKKPELYKNTELSQKMLSPRKIMEGVVDGVNFGGNCSGIPTPQGFIYFDDSYQGKPLVFVGTVGLIPKKNGKRLLYKKKAEPNDYIVMVGGKVGLDGIHGATFSSESLDSGSPATAVQIGDPITQKKVSDVLVKEARDLDLYNSITDNGAGGLSSSVAEMAKEAGGLIVELNKVPLKYPGLDAWQIWISESQERMTLSVPKEKWKELHSLLKKRGVIATIVGEFTKEKKCIVKYKGKTLVDLDMEFLHNGLPVRKLKTIKPKTILTEVKIGKPKDANGDFLDMLAQPNNASFAFISEQYDHEVQGSSVLKPLQGRGRINGSASVVKPVLDSNKGVVVSQGINPSYSLIDTYHMASCAIDTAIRNLVSVGGNPDMIALLDNFCWCSSTEPTRLWQLKRAVKACYDYATVFQTPFISGKDSMFNDFKGFDKNGANIKISILPTLLISSIGVIDDISKTVSLDVKFSEDLVYIIGETFEEMGGSEYFAYQSKKLKREIIGKSVPKVNAKKNLKMYRKFYKAVQKDLIASAVSVGIGGLGMALAKMSLGGMKGINIDLSKVIGIVKRDDYCLYSESQGRIVVTINPDNKEKFEKTMNNISIVHIGGVRKDDQIVIKDLKGNNYIKTNLKKSLGVYQKTLGKY